jgi:hypothetical protein
MEGQMKKRCLFLIICFSVLLVLISFGMLGCGGGSSSGGGGGGSSSPDAPVLQSVETIPNSAPAGATVSSMLIRISFTDQNGDLGGGSFSYNYEGETTTIPISENVTGMKSGTIGTTGRTLKISPTVGTINVPCWLIDRAGNKSNTFNYNFKQL